MWLSSCASKDFREPEVHSASTDSVSKTYGRSYTDVWNAVLSALQSKRYAIAETKREGGSIVTDWILGKSDRLYSGYGETRIPYSVRFKMTVKLRPSREGVKVLIENQEQFYTDAVTAGTDFQGSLYQWIPTKSSGDKESALLSEVGEHLSSTQPPKQPPKGKK